MTRTEALAVLGLTSSASALDIRRAYRRLVLAHHPDRTHNAPGSNEAFLKVVRAYEVLKATTAPPDRPAAVPPHEIRYSVLPDDSRHDRANRAAVVMLGLFVSLPCILSMLPAFIFTGEWIALVYFVVWEIIVVCLLLRCMGRPRQSR